MANGFELQLERKMKSAESAVQSAFIKGNTLIHLLKIIPTNKEVQGVSDTELIKIKFEVDTNPPEGATYEIRYGLLPIPYAVQMYDEASLFAGKIHAVLCRSWKSRIKGRDYYDYLWYLARGAKVNIQHLQKRLEQSSEWSSSEELTIEKTIELLCSRFAVIDFERAKQDVLPFISDIRKLDLWNKDLFCAVTREKLRS